MTCRGVEVRVDVLGSLRVTVGGAEVPIGSPMQRRLLAALVVHAGEVVTTGRLVGALWGGSPPATAVESLRTYVYRLRTTLGDDGGSLVTRPAGYLLELEDDRIDAGRFERLLAEARGETDLRAGLGHLEQALDLWRGGAYGEFAEGGPGDAHPAFAEAARLEELRRLAMERRFDVRLALGEHTEIVGELEAFVADEPLRERVRGQLVLALYRCGRQADALAAIRGLREHLGRELGLDVPAWLTRLERDVLRRADALDLPSALRTSGAGTDDPQRMPPRGPAGPVGPVPPHLPAEAAELIGRADDLAQLRVALTRTRLVTLTGVGGVGKTRLALRVAHEIVEEHPDGGWWCDLAPIGAAGEVAGAVATTLGARPSGGDDPVSAVLGVLGERRALLVLDNCEHVAAGVAPLLRAVMRTCPRTTVLATSRAPLRVDGERLHRLAPLPIGGPDEPGPALELFLARSRAARPDLADDPAERRRMVGICQRLDGLPLAIELAASRLRSLNPADLADRLGERLDFLTDRRDDGRHRGLRAVVDWSYGLLSKVERRLFARLSVFAGAFTLEAAEAVATGDGIAESEVADLIGGLVDHSLVTLLPTGGPARYTMLETLRAYGRERLRDTGRLEAVRRRHAEYHVDLAESADAQVRSRDEAVGVARLDRSLDDLRAVHRWAVAAEEPDVALRLVAAVFRYALFRLRTEVLGWAQHAVEVPGADQHRSLPTVAGAAGWLAGLRGDLPGAVSWAERGLDVLDDPRDPRALVPLEVRMHVALWSGHLDACIVDADRAAELADDPYDLVPRYVPGLALTYAGHAEQALARLDDVLVDADRHGNPTMRALVLYARAEALLAIEPSRAVDPLESAAELAAAVDSRMVLGVIDVSLVSIEARRGGSRRSLATFAAVIDRLHEAGDWTHLWTGLRGLVGVLARLGRDRDAAVLLAALRALDNAPPIYGEDAERLAAVATELEARLGDDASTDAEVRGRAMTPQAAVAFARRAISDAM